MVNACIDGIGMVNARVDGSVMVNAHLLLIAVG